MKTTTDKPGVRVYTNPLPRWGFVAYIGLLVLVYGLMIWAFLR